MAFKAQTAHRPIRVLSTTSRGANPTVTMLIDSLPDSIEVVRFTWGRALFSRYDLVHVHWPDRLTRQERWTRVKQVLFAIMIARLAISRIPTVWTVHNLAPHEPGSAFESFLISRWKRTVDRHVYMYEAAVPPGSPPYTVIRRGDYSPLFGDRVAVPAARNIFLTAGYLRPYKGVESLVRAFDDMSDFDGQLRIAGEPLTAGYGDSLTQLVSSLDNVYLDLRRLSDSEFAAEVERCEAVILPYLRMYNSGVALLALTLKRPLIVPNTPTMQELRDEVGRGWVITYEGEINESRLRAAIEELRSHARAEGPDLSRRSWGQVGEQYASLYHELVSRQN